MMGPKPRSRWERQEPAPSGSMLHGGKPSPGDTPACSAWAPLGARPHFPRHGRQGHFSCMMDKRCSPITRWVMLSEKQRAPVPATQRLGNA